MQQKAGGYGNVLYPPFLFSKAILPLLLISDFCMEVSI